MTWGDWRYTNTTSPALTTGLTATYSIQPGTLVTYAPQLLAGSGGGTWVPAPQSALDWLDSEVEGTCRVARAA